MTPENLPGRAVNSASDHHDMANAIRALAMDAVQRANSGHPGMPMGTADIATVLFTKFMKFDPAQPSWPDRDRFVLSAGHGSMLLYALLHLLGFEDMPLEEIKNFRQLGSKTAGHPEYGHAAGIEATTGPLGQGLAAAVGMSLAEALLRTKFGSEVVDHYTYVLASDGDLMEGISHEAISLAGHLRLSKLIVLYDDNQISIDGPLDISESGDALQRFKAAGWNAARIDGHDPQAIAKAITEAQKSDRPSLIACRTIIGYGAPNKQGTAACHGAPLGEKEIKLARKKLGWDHDPFDIPCNIRDAWRIVGLKAAKHRGQWLKRLGKLDPELQAEFKRRLNGEIPKALDQALIDYKTRLAQDAPKLATRKASENTLNVISPLMPELIGGSADLTGSNNTKASDQTAITADDFSGRFIHYGVREHAMAAAMNGISLHGGIRPYSGTFLIFSDYCRPAIRLSALMQQPVIYVMTHDSIGLGEDGPTHQPIEHLASLRAMPNLNVFRPADAMETVECWQAAIVSTKTPSLLALSRQSLPALRTNNIECNMCARGAYDLIRPDSETSDVVIFASGSEVSIAVEAREQLQEKGINTRVVSVPCFELFEAQEDNYKARIIGQAPVRIAVEAAVRQGWDRFIGSDGIFIGMTGFGASAPAEALYQHFAITTQAIVDAATSKLA